MQKQIDPDGVLVALVPTDLEHEPRNVDFEEIDMISVLNWFIIQELDILAFAV